MSNPLNFAVVGAGGFAYFAVTEFVKIPGVKFFGVYDEDERNANRMKNIDSSIIIYSSLEELCKESAIHLVYIATPPFLHYPQSKMALQAGKHVICEKPAATQLSHALELSEIATENHLLFVVNLMQRYNVLYESVGELIRRNLLGEFLHGYFENYASDEVLNEQHWFWDEGKSGGIFIEHGVHFFDMFSGWLGEGKVIASQKVNRPQHSNVWDKVQATVLYAKGLVNFYHAFDQPKIMDRQEMRLQFEKGDITLFEWVPTRLTLTALCSESDLQMLRTLFSNAEIVLLESHESSKMVKGRFKQIHYQYKIKLDTGDVVQKQTLYQELVTKMFRDQLQWIHDRKRIRKIDHKNAINSLRLAEGAERIAVKLID